MQGIFSKQESFYTNELNPSPRFRHQKVTSNSLLEKKITVFDQENLKDNFPKEPKIKQTFSIACWLLKHQEYSSSYKLLRQLLNKSPYCLEFIKKAIFCAEKLNRNEELLQLNETLFKIDDHPLHIENLAHTLYKNGQEKEALKYFYIALQSLGQEKLNLFNIYKTMGNIYLKVQNIDLAQDCYHKAFRLNSFDSVLLTNLATLDIQLNQWKAAQEKLCQAILFTSDYDPAWVGLALVHRHYGDKELSWANLEKSIDLNPTQETALELALSWVVNDQKYNLVISWLKAYLAQNFMDEKMSLALAQLFFLKGLNRQSQLELERTLALNPQNRSALTLFSMIREKPLSISN